MSPPTEASEPTFYEMFEAGSARLRDIDDFIDRWHSRAGEKDLPPLHEYLGLTRAQYDAWVMDPTSLIPPIGIMPRASWIRYRVTVLKSTVERIRAHYDGRPLHAEYETALAEWEREIKDHETYLASLPGEVIQRSEKRG